MARENILVIRQLWHRSLSCFPKWFLLLVRGNFEEVIKYLFSWKPTFRIFAMIISFVCHEFNKCRNFFILYCIVFYYIVLYCDFWFTGNIKTNVKTSRQESQALKPRRQASHTGSHDKGLRSSLPIPRQRKITCTPKNIATGFVENASDQLINACNRDAGSTVSLSRDRMLRYIKNIISITPV